MHLESHDGGAGFTPSFKWSRPRPQIADAIALLATLAVQDYFHHLSEGPSDLMDEKLADLFDRIREAQRAHESFLIKSGAR